MWYWRLTVSLYLLHAIQREREPCRIYLYGYVGKLDIYRSLRYVSYKKPPSYFREAADKVWEMAEEYRAKGYLDLAAEIKGLATQLHDAARKRELVEKNGQPKE